MKTFRFKKIDAFATATSGGNPAAVVYLDSFEAITEPEMQRIARELKGFVCEVGYVARLAPDAFKVRYFSAEKEVQFCGHATIAIMHDLVTHDPGLAALERVLLHTNKGVLAVQNRDGAVFIQAPEPVFSECRIGAAEICAALDLPESVLDPAIGTGIVNAGNQTLCLALKTCRDVAGVVPDFQTVLAFCNRHQLDVITVFSRQVAHPENHFRTRVFAAPFGYLEDPATGSGNAALGYHLQRCGQWGGGPIRIEQNADLENPNIVLLSSVADAEHGVRVIFGGGAIPRIEGRYCL
jgi:PhzF family phenazine biosynthesis protein